MSYCEDLSQNFTLLKKGEGNQKNEIRRKEKKGNLIEKVDYYI